MASKSTRLTPPTTKPAAPRSVTRTSMTDMGSAETERKTEAPTSIEDQIRARAYDLWEQAGRPEGDGVQFWLEAEKEQKAPR